QRVRRRPGRQERARRRALSTADRLPCRRVGPLLRCRHRLGARNLLGGLPVTTTPLRLACLDADAPPLFGLLDPSTGRRSGFEPAVAELIGAELGRPIEWICVPWTEMIPAAQSGAADAVL